MSSYTFKLVLLGQGSVGKTSLLLRYISNVFNESHQSTIQASFLRKQLYLDRDLVKLEIWDTAGQERYHALGPIYYRDANGALLVYDVTNPESLRKVRDWVKELNKMLGTNNIRLAIIGNKVDLLTLGEQKSPQNNPIIQEAMQFANELQNARHYLTSAKLSHGISELFTSVSKRMIDQSKKVALARQASGRTSSRALRSSLSVADDDVLEEWRSNHHPYGSRIDLRNNRNQGPSGTTSRSCTC